MVRRFLALCSALALLGLVLFTTIHVHGVSDRDASHSFGHYFVFAQAQAGFLLLALIFVIFNGVLHGRVTVACRLPPPEITICSYASRAPPAR